MENKVCNVCQIEKSTTQFSKKKTNKDGLETYCKDCYKVIWGEYNREYNLKRKSLYDYSDPFYFENSKVCTKCNIEKPLTEYGRDAKGTNGLKCLCNDCRKPIYGKLKVQEYNPAIYSIIDKTNGEVLYIGETKTPEIRKERHFKNTNHSKIAKLISSGELNPDTLLFEIIEYVEDKRTRLDREKYWIKTKQPKYNIMHK